MREEPQTVKKLVSRWLHGIFATAIRTARRAPRYKKLYVFDFDGTLFRSPPPPKSYEDKPAWWSDPVSLDPSTVGEEPGPDMWHEETVRAMKEAIADPNAYVVVMTGRHNSLQDRIQEILEGAGLKPDELITNPEIGKTSQYKQQEMAYLLRQFPNVREVEFWEDRKPDLKGYQRFGEQLGVKFTPKLVKNYDRELPPYLGVFLSPGDREKLLRDFAPKHENVQADHVTLMFRPTEEDMENLREDFRLGQQVPLKITGYAEDDKGQALVVELPSELQSHTQRSPHITLSIAPGVEPVYSNELVKGPIKEITPRTVRGVIDGGPREPTPKTEPRETLTRKEKRQLWKQFLQEETRNPEFGRGGRKERIQRKTLYDAGGAGRRQVLREWESQLRERQQRS